MAAAATRRGSNPRLDLDSSDHGIDIPATPPAKSAPSPSSFVSLFLPFSVSILPESSTATAIAIAAWYTSNIGVLLINKYLLSVYGFRFPIFLTALHMIACSLLSAVFARFFPRQRISSRRQLIKIVALSLVFCLSVVAGNTSLRYIPVSFNQAIGATTPFFTAVFSVAITCRREPPLVYLALLPVVLGIVLASNSEPLFHLFGFLVCVGSVSARALKSVLQGILLSSESEKLNSMTLLLYMAPMAAAVLLPLSLYIEGNVWAETLARGSDDPRLFLYLIGNATVAFLVNLTNFKVTDYTSPLTLQVLGNAKSVVAAVVSVMIFRNPVTVMGMVGFAITVAGVFLYSEAKKRTRSQSSSSSSSNSGSNLSSSPSH